MTALASIDLLALIRTFLTRDSHVSQSSPFSKDALLEEAWNHGLAPLLYQHPALAQYPDEFHHVLKLCYIRSTAHFTRRAKSLTTLCDEFRYRGIDAVPFKGIGLSQRLFGDIALRHCTDHDILVKKQQAHAALQTLLDLGYRPSSNLPIAELAGTLDRFYSIELHHPESKVLVDLQWDIANGYVSLPMGEEALFLRTCDLSILGQNVPFFEDSVTLYLLCIHGAKNSWCELRALIDLAMMTKLFPAPVWREAADLLRAQGLSAMMTTGVLLAHQLLGVTVPAVADEMVDHRARRLAAVIHDFWMVTNSKCPSVWQSFKWDLRFRKWGREKVRYFIFRLRPTRADWQTQGSVVPLIYLKRFARIILPKYF